VAAPFCRQLQVGSVGVDVVCLRTALRRGRDGRGQAFFSPTTRAGRESRYYGVGLQGAVKYAQRFYGLPQTGTYGPQLHAKIQHFYTSAGQAQLIRLVRERDATRRRAAVVAWARRAIAQSAVIGYDQPRRAERWGVLGQAAGASVFRNRDCSSQVIECFFLAGEPDPCGLNYRWIGWTGCLADKGWRVPLSDVLPGDLVLWRPWETSGHVALVLDEDGTVMTHGKDSDPRPDDVWYREAPTMAVRFIR
jgi:hypothetical protein